MPSLFVDERASRQSVGVSYACIRLSPLKYFQTANPQAVRSIHTALTDVCWTVAVGNPQVHALRQCVIHR
jgi:hypothetical protein